MIMQLGSTLKRNGLLLLCTMGIGAVFTLILQLFSMLVLRRFVGNYILLLQEKVIGSSLGLSLTFPILFFAAALVKDLVPLKLHNVLYYGAVSLGAALFCVVLTLFPRLLLNLLPELPEAEVFQHFLMSIKGFLVSAPIFIGALYSSGAGKPIGRACVNMLITGSVFLVLHVVIYLVQVVFIALGTWSNAVPAAFLAFIPAYFLNRK